jgi:hypothetical protein
MVAPEPNLKRQSNWGWYLALILCPVIAVGYYLIVVRFIGDVEDRGQFGDAFGGLTALVTSLAFVGLLWTISLQRRDIDIQREELKLSRKIQEDQKNVLEDQRDLQRLQAFEATFFNLLKSFDGIVDSTSIPGGGGGNGRDELANRFSGYQGFIRARDAELKATPNSSALQDRDRIACFHMAFEGAQYDPSRIFQTLQSILLFIKDPPSTESTDFYAKILAAHMGLAEKWFVYMWAESHPNFDSFIELALDSGLLRSMPGHIDGIQLRLDDSGIDIGSS